MDPGRPRRKYPDGLICSVAPAVPGAVHGSHDTVKLNTGAFSRQSIWSCPESSERDRMSFRQAKCRLRRTSRQ
jgi:hypothetical protein